MKAVQPVWQRTQSENLIRHRSGTYYLNAKISGKKVRVSLKTDNLKLAKIARDEVLNKLRSEAEGTALRFKTLGDALNLVEDRAKSTADLKQSTKEFYGHLCAGLRKTFPVDLEASEWSEDEAREWWSKFSKKHSTTHANNALRLITQIGELLVEDGSISKNPAKVLRRKKAKDKAVRPLPSVAVLDSIIESVRSGPSTEAADLIEFLAWSGLRIGEAREVKWEDIGAGWLLVTGGESKTKNHRTRRVPINERLRLLLERRRPSSARGKVFKILTPREALTSACERLGLEHLRVHDLRHWFATHAIEKGVDIPTVSKWLGHLDGGALAMKVYGHLRDEHSLRAAEKLG
ncbi:site-specific integrase [Luteolibacter pohnpeiensis]|uniref:Site-specific integrase n=1 Tax=Luteolibacter pohnpeiensis TaxID=454153 RepID=A0A934S796_9BACT|nr:site-specific integrase [Luteolibacter pohnpeiensis]MBK1881007.1 site-specific integrase [Luteolibacter pohnpeiensis]